ncbi:D-alanyl-D-alanine carboxypeptidase DacC precursor [Pseudovibrio axinellae]|uniref:D-alanyl-D-alanine carboxypeptidase DacC n=1 Tax=Pseudovibrio axinellae TaxID=989403 RepID=A0A165ZP74_9HYPH|nr:D-alanyl-D-alanine carboxypeptidase family protein [Pseudovibrio axinellae]KZL20112.1 D-alanyl-D-alanine carboxypeptidase DacC precursor [Pseudovibrio axinellae]SEQ24857.1 D-alanyl-D-alanine carboxypeptidase [Pseudovibrio axinellae]
MNFSIYWIARNIRFVSFFAVALAAALSSARADIATWLLLDADNGRVLEQHGASDRWYPASLTKMMTAYVAFQTISKGEMAMSDMVMVSQNALNQPPSKMGFKVGTTITLDNALKMILVKSANDIAVAIAERLGGTEENFIKRMNATSRRLGMTHTNFVNPHGLPDNRQVTSARDMAILARALWQEFPQYRAYLSHPGIRFGRRTFRSGNRDYLLRTAGANGLKTGYICNSGFNVATSATRNGRTIIAVILGAASSLERSAFAQKLIDSGFKKTNGARISSFRGSGNPNPPKDHYCKRNAKPTAQQLVDRFGSKRGAVGMMAYADAASPSPSGKSIRLSKKKVNWSLVYEEILGPQLKDYAPVTVRIGNEHPVVALKKLGNGVPLPMPKPGSETSLENKPIGGILNVPIGKGASLHPLRSNTRRDLFGSPGGLYANTAVFGRRQ